MSEIAFVMSGWTHLQGQRPLRGHSAISSAAVVPTYPALLVQGDDVPPCDGLVNVFAMASLLPPSPVTCPRILLVYCDIQWSSC